MLCLTKEEREKGTAVALGYFDGMTGETKVELTLPKVDLSVTNELKDVLAQMGINAAFGDEADFTGISETVPLKISSVLQKARLTIDEEGTKAAAATAIAMAMRMAPMDEEVVEMKNGVKKTVQRKLFPGYVLLNMDMNDDTWYVVRNTRGVTGFVGPGSKPVPLTEAEMKPLGIKTDNVTVDFVEGDSIAVVAGVWKDTVGVVQKIDHGKQTATINVELFGRETPVEISFAEVRKL